ncbi:MAG TPA: hypothetical protein ENK91_06590, partial [Bacteroidetes bacterium]|nr:hypothetical protein [Bacteroidota bacterium]
MDFVKDFARDRLFIKNLEELYPMAQEAKELLGKKRMKVIADKGYTTGEEIAKCSAENIITWE